MLYLYRNSCSIFHFLFGTVEDLRCKEEFPDMTAVELALCLERWCFYVSFFFYNVSITMMNIYDTWILHRDIWHGCFVLIQTQRFFWGLISSGRPSKPNSSNAVPPETPRWPRWSTKPGAVENILWLRYVEIDDRTDDSWDLLTSPDSDWNMTFFWYTLWYFI